MSEKSEQELSKSEKRLIERNRQKAVILKRSKLVPHPYAISKVISENTTTLKIGPVKLNDTGGGFFIEEDPKGNDNVDPVVLVQPEAPIFDPDRPTCEKCNKVFATSWLFNMFTFKCCDTWKDPKVHKLITKSEAKDIYLLKDVDLDKREPPLKFILKKNPHNARWGDMKLYLLIQVKKRALEVWGSEEKIEKERQRRQEKRVVTKSKKYEKQMKELRKGMRSTYYDRTGATHTHEFGPETYNADKNTYHRNCTTCPYEETFEKM